MACSLGPAFLIFTAVFLVIFFLFQQRYKGLVFSDEETGIFSDEETSIRSEMEDED